MDSKLTHLLLVIFFAGSIVAIGTKELQDKYALKQGKSNLKQLIVDLKQENSLAVRGRKARATKESLEEGAPPDQEFRDAAPPPQSSKVERFLEKFFPKKNVEEN